MSKKVASLEIKTSHATVDLLLTGMDDDAIKREAELLAKARRGDQSAYGELARVYRPMMLRFTAKWLFNQNDSEDIAQEAFAIGWRKIHEFCAEAEFTTWIASIARNLCRNANRKEVRRRNFIEIADYAELESLESDFSWPSEGETSGLSDAEIAQILKKRMKSLNAIEQRSLVLRNEGHSYEEIADVLQFPIGTIKSAISRAKSKLSQAVKDYL